ncbi:hypothetical protein F2Q68_00009876 [Brassica cretica]|uniref:Uncharacterized protein n=1 Tax=Brassica cretica TaxID=69181 RepID=A0A8S9KWH6_BRACR|nr:hypothetical protein F2Q68_00009876 [Brassica cretica]
MWAVVEIALVAFCGAIQNVFKLYRTAAWYQNYYGTRGPAVSGILSWSQGFSFWNFKILDVSSRDPETMECIFLKRGGSGIYRPETWRRLSMTRSSCSLLPLGSIHGYTAGKSGRKVVGICFFVEFLLRLLVRPARLDVELTFSSAPMLGKQASGRRQSNSCNSPGDWAGPARLLLAGYPLMLMVVMTAPGYSGSSRRDGSLGRNCLSMTKAARRAAMSIELHLLDSNRRDLHVVRRNYLTRNLNPEPGGWNLDREQEPGSRELEAGALAGHQPPCFCDMRTRLRPLVPGPPPEPAFVGVKNGYDEVNIQNVRRRKQKTFFDKYFFEIDSSLRKALRRKHETSDKSSKRVATQRPNACSARSLRSERARAKAWSLPTELEPKLGRSRAEARSLRSDRALPKRRYDISPCILVNPSMLSPEDRSEPISRFPPF